MESLTSSEEYKEGVKKVGPGSIFYYRCIFDPVPSRDLRCPEKYGAELDSNEPAQKPLTDDSERTS